MLFFHSISSKWFFSDAIPFYWSKHLFSFNCVNMFEFWRNSVFIAKSILDSFRQFYLTSIEQYAFLWYVLISFSGFENSGIKTHCESELEKKTHYFDDDNTLFIRFHSTWGILNERPLLKQFHSIVHYVKISTHWWQYTTQLNKNRESWKIYSATNCNLFQSNFYSDFSRHSEKKRTI